MADGTQKTTKLERAMDYLRQNPTAPNKQVAQACGVSNATAWFAREQLGLPGTRTQKTTKLERAMDYLRQNPTAPNKQVALSCGVSNATAWFAREQLGLPVLTHRKRRGPARGGTLLENVTAYVRLHPQATTAQVQAATGCTDDYVTRARQLAANRPPMPAASADRRMALHLRLLLEHSRKCFDQECDRCLTADALLESDELGSLSVLADLVEGALVLRVRLEELLDCIQARRGPDQQRELAVLAANLRARLRQEPRFADLPDDLRQRAREQLGSDATAELVLQLREQIAAQRLRARPDGQRAEDSAVIADLNETVADLAADNLRLRRLAGELSP